MEVGNKLRQIEHCSTRFIDSKVSAGVTLCERLGDKKEFKKTSKLHNLLAHSASKTL